VGAVLGGGAPLRRREHAHRVGRPDPDFERLEEESERARSLHAAALEKAPRAVVA
jgi:hypothetical protein